jgi:hypothetical protein
MTPKSAVTVSNMATILRPSANDLTAEVVTQSKEFREKLNFESLMMILCNTRGSRWDSKKTGLPLQHPAGKVAGSMLARHRKVSCNRCCFDTVGATGRCYIEASRGVLGRRRELGRPGRRALLM